MLKKYFKDESYNIMPCGVVAFQNDSTLKIISANDYYYSTYANGNFESLNICEKDKNIIADLKDKNEVVYKCIVSDGTIRYICMHLTNIMKMIFSVFLLTLRNSIRILSG